ncbi:MAG: hypothetical protein OEY11_12300 [Gammaproteobacteria bacterium]|nr:hypothetical protein [Gammaproteobacteria bacterium]
MTLKNIILSVIVLAVVAVHGGLFFDGFSLTKDECLADKNASLNRSMSAQVKVDDSVDRVAEQHRQKEIKTASIRQEIKREVARNERANKNGIRPHHDECNLNIGTVQLLNSSRAESLPSVEYTGQTAKQKLAASTITRDALIDITFDCQDAYNRLRHEKDSLIAIVENYQSDIRDFNNEK